METNILNRITSLFDNPVMQNNLRGLYVEAMVAELLGPGWHYTGGDWAGWDLEHEKGTRVEVKQSAREQTWGVSKSAPRFDIKAASGHYPDGVTYVKNSSSERLADFYIFAWHEGTDQRAPEQWEFYVVPSSKLPKQQKSIGLIGIRTLAASITSSQLRYTLYGSQLPAIPGPFSGECCISSIPISRFRSGLC